MQEYLHVVLHAAIDTAKILPFLFIVYYVIELIEFKFAIKIKNNKMLKGKASPVFGSLLGCIPQCGFSVISTDLFGKGAISVGALIAVYIATSDEAIPIMLSSPSSIPWMLALIAIKIVLGIAVGYLAILLHKLIFKKKVNYIEENTNKVEKHSHKEEHKHNEHNHEEHEHKESEDSTLIPQDGCCHHHVDDKSFDWVHPLLHCVKIGLFILIINLVFGSIVHFVGEDKIINFLNAGKFAQPLLAVVIGLIPNCASSVILADLFVMGGLSFGALVSGLCVNAGLGVIMLIKQNKNWKETLFIVLTLLISSLIAGYALIFI